MRKKKTTETPEGAEIEIEIIVEAELYAVLVGFNFGADNRRVQKGETISALELGSEVLADLTAHEPPVLERIAVAAEGEN